MNVVFVQHATALGGSALSLVYTVRGLREHGINCTVAFASPAPEVASYYANEGIRVIPSGRIRTFEHTTASWASLLRLWRSGSFVMARLNARNSRRAMRELVDQTEADVYHLNSVVLYDAATALQGMGRKFVWHVRESPVNGYLGLRLGIIRRALTSSGVTPIFLSEYDMYRWTGRKWGVVVPNFVDKNFTVGGDRDLVRAKLAIPADSNVVLYLGGLAEIKGWRYLLEALQILKSRGLRVICIAPGTNHSPPGSWKGQIARKMLPLVGLGTPIQQYERSLVAHGLAKDVLRLPFETKVEGLIAACDILAFPSIRPHFARPVMEAAMMGRPAIASDLPGVRETIVPHQTGVLVSAMDSEALANGMGQLFSDPIRRREMGDAAKALAQERFDKETQIEKIMNVYRTIVHRRH